MRKILLLAAVLLASAPIVTQAEEITLLPAIKLQIGDRDSYGHYWDGGRWRDKDYWHRHYEYRDKHWRKLEKNSVKPTRRAITTVVKTRRSVRKNTINTTRIIITKTTTGPSGSVLVPAFHPPKIQLIIRCCSCFA